MANPDRRGYTETCGEAWGERQLGGSGAGVKEVLEAGALALGGSLCGHKTWMC